jgi:ferrous iron transport protein A
LRLVLFGVESKLEINYRDMEQSKIVTLDRMKSGQKGKVFKITGGRTVQLRLEALGVFPGTNIKKISAFLSGGPIVFEAEKTQIAIGFGMAQKILIEVEK